VLSVELHAHSAHSHDGRDPVEALCERAAAVGLDALAVTDHDTVDGTRRLLDVAPEYDLVPIPGLEVSSAAGHILALGVEEAVSPGLPYHETLDRIHDLGGTVVVPHPFQKSRHGVVGRVDRDALAAADAVETYNSRLLTGIANHRARRFAESRDLPATAGSDAHIASMVGRAVTEVDTDERSAGAVLDAVAAGRTSVVGTRTPWRVSAAQATGNARRRVVRRLGDLF
jgi:predicted metal-dependent phosphoesterase TrpH